MREKPSAHALSVAMDIDYRPYGWKSMEETVEVLFSIAKKCDLVIGTREEFEVVGFDASYTDVQCAQKLFEHGVHLVVIKHGKDGVALFSADGEEARIEALPARLVKPWGAGDAFASSFLSSLLENVSYTDALIHGAASASLVISGTSCTEAMPTREEIETFVHAWRTGTLDDSWND